MDAAGLHADTLRAPRTARELSFAAAFARARKQERAAPWPVLVLCARADSPALATTRRILLREGASLRPAAAIVLNTSYWGTADPPLAWSDAGLATVVARHELYHARRAWLRSQEVTASAAAIEERLGSTVDRKALESMVDQALAAREEVEAIDRSLDSAVLLAAHRRGMLLYREQSRQRGAESLEKLLRLFEPLERPETHRWLSELFRQTLSPAVSDIVP